MIKNVFFDLDGTIFDFHASEREAICETMAFHGVSPTDENVRIYSEVNISQWKLLELGQLTRPVLRVRRFELFFERLGIKADAEKAATMYENDLMTKCHYIPHAQEVLEKLHGKYRLYLATNGYERTQKGRIAASGIGKYFDRIFISQAVGYDKPVREYFERCFETIPDFSREQTVMIGDSLSSDILGANNAGISSVWFDKTGSPPVGARPDYTVRDLREIPPLLETM